MRLVYPSFLDQVSRTSFLYKKLGSSVRGLSLPTSRPMLDGVIIITVYLTCCIAVSRRLSGIIHLRTHLLHPREYGTFTVLYWPIIASPVLLIVVAFAALRYQNNKNWIASAVDDGHTVLLSNATFKRASREREREILTRT